MGDSAAHVQEVLDEGAVQALAWISSSSHPVVALGGAVKSGKTTLFSYLARAQPHEGVNWIYWNLLDEPVERPEVFFTRLAMKLGLPRDAFDGSGGPGDIEAVLEIHDVGKSERLILVVDEWDDAHQTHSVPSVALMNLILAIKGLGVARANSPGETMAGFGFVGITRFPSANHFLMWAREQQGRGNSNFVRLSDVTARLSEFNRLPPLSKDAAVHLGHAYGYNDERSLALHDFCGGWLGLMAKTLEEVRPGEDLETKATELLPGFINQTAAMMIRLTAGPSARDMDLAELLAWALTNYPPDDFELPRSNDGAPAPVLRQWLQPRTYLVVDTEGLVMPFSKAWETYGPDHAPEFRTFGEFSRGRLRGFIEAIQVRYEVPPSNVVLVGRPGNRIGKLFGDLPEGWRTHTPPRGNQQRKDGTDDIAGIAWVVSKSSAEPASRFVLIVSDMDWYSPLIQLRVSGVTCIPTSGTSHELVAGANHLGWSLVTDALEEHGIVRPKQTNDSASSNRRGGRRR